jgi:hypothetical protein
MQQAEFFIFKKINFSFQGIKAPNDMSIASTEVLVLGFQ